MDEFGHSRIYEMFLANVRSRGHQDGLPVINCWAPWRQELKSWMLFLLKKLNMF
jgi:hypothetical protein